MDKLDWIKDLVLAEQKMEESGMVDFSAGFDPESTLLNETVQFLDALKNKFVESASAFNQLKGSAVGRIKIYGISKTHADFMLFRNGYKLIFSMRQPGLIAITFNHLGTSYIPTGVPQVTSSGEEDLLHSHWGAFGDLIWTYQGQNIRLDYLMRYYLSRFIRESAK